MSSRISPDSEPKNKCVHSSLSGITILFQSERTLTEMLIIFDFASQFHISGRFKKLSKRFL